MECGSKYVIWDQYEACELQVDSGIPQLALFVGGYARKVSLPVEVLDLNLYEQRPAIYPNTYWDFQRDGKLEQIYIQK
jgi:hypothetical protein